MTMDGKKYPNRPIPGRRPGRIIVSCALAVCVLVACGGGTGLGPGEIQKREDKLRQRLPIDWNDYNAEDPVGSIEAFTKTLAQADAQDGIELGVRNQVKAEAQNGIGWSFIRLQDLPAASQSFGIATQLDRTNADAWVGWAGVALALRQYADVLQYTNTALENDPDYNSATRIDPQGQVIGHDAIDERHVRLMLAEANFQLGRYSAVDRPDPNNAAAQVSLIDRTFRYRDPGQLLERISELSLELQDLVSAG
jgi:tetratricopeptide (TPR) repeat protein